MDSWHDYHLTGYSVAGAKRQITFDISWPYETANEIKQTTVVFSEVEGYFFEHDLGVNILYSIVEEPLEKFLSQNAARFEKEKKWGWPLFWRDTIEQTLGYFDKLETRLFEISSSYGLSGWILASKVASHDSVS